jgi:hypothetical protein
MAFRHRRLALLLLAGLGAGCESSLSKDLDEFCRVINEVNAKETSLTATDKLGKIDERKAEFQHPLPVGSVNVWERLGQLSGDEKYKYILAVARSEGKNNWTCAPYGKLVNQAEFEKQAKETREKEKAEAEAKAQADAAAQAEAAKAAAAKPAKHDKAAAPAKTSSKKKKKKH